MTADQERALVAAFLLCGETIIYEETVDAREQLGIDEAIGELVKANLVEHARWDTDICMRVYRLTPEAIKKFKGE